MAFDLISSTTLGSATATVTLSSIPQTYTHLYLVANAIAEQNNYYSYANIRINGVSGSGLYTRILAFTDSTGGFTYGTATDIAFRSYGLSGAYNTSFRGYMTVFIPNYTSTDSPKPIWSTAGVPVTNTNQVTGFYGNSVNSASGVTSITIENQAGSNISSGSTFYLYGI